MSILLTLLDIVLLALVIGDQTTACPRASADQGTFATAEQTTHYRATRGRAADNFGLRVVPGVRVMLLSFGTVVRLLTECVQGEQGESCH